MKEEIMFNGEKIDLISLCREIGNWYGDFFMNEKG
jgi:hypothetical protein